MPITFDTLEELKEFCQNFNLEGGKRPAGLKKAIVAKTVQEEDDAPAPKKRGRKPNAEKAQQAAPAKNGRAVRATAAEDVAPKRKGRPPSAQKAAPVKPKRDKSQTLTAKIQTAIQNYLDKDASFTANDVYAILAKKDDSINKQSVITSVLKQMNSVYNTVSVTERPGNGPRPVKLYNAA